MPESPTTGGRPLRRDAQANRARLLAAASEIFSAEGIEAPLDEIARRAGVGAGTVHRHFPTKAALVGAAIAEPVNVLAGRAAEMIDGADPTAAFFVFVEELVVNGAAAHAFADRLRSDADDVKMAIAEPLARLRAGLATLLDAAQRGGGVRGDIDAGLLDAFIAAAHAAYVHPTGGIEAISLVTDGLRTRGPVRPRHGRARGSKSPPRTLP